MAAAGNALRLCFRAYTRAPTVSSRLATPSPTTRFSIAHHRRAFATTPNHQAPKDQEEGDQDSTPNPYYHLEDAFKDLSPEELKQLEQSIKDEDETGNESIGLNRFLEKEEPELRRAQGPDQVLKTLLKSPKPNKESFWFDPDDPNTLTEDTGDEFKDEDDISSMAHGKLDEVREHRHYARVAAWEMPLLSKLAKPFEPPTAETPLRFRYTTYMGEFHPGERKVVVQFSPNDLPGMTEVQRNKLKKLAGARYNPEKNEIRMGCDSFEQAAQNKRYLSDQIDTLIETAKDPKDTFEDVPLDTRHHKTVVKPKFPKEWRLTPERKSELAALRGEASKMDASKEAQGQLVDGTQAIEALMESTENDAKARKAEAETVPVGRGAGKGGKGSKGGKPPKQAKAPR